MEEAGLASLAAPRTGGHRAPEEARPGAPRPVRAQETYSPSRARPPSSLVLQREGAPDARPQDALRWRPVGLRARAGGAGHAAPQKGKRPGGPGRGWSAVSPRPAGGRRRGFCKQTPAPSAPRRPPPTTSFLPSSGSNLAKAGRRGSEQPLSVGAARKAPRPAGRGRSSSGRPHAAWKVRERGWAARGPGLHACAPHPTRPPVRRGAGVAGRPAPAERRAGS